MTHPSPKHTNRLIHASSPYLLQHAHNPVDWWEWCDEAFDKARKEDKMVLISIGYSACHWCHVMERESFEDEEVATLMNNHFVCIKVDREERPDVDQLYMDAVQLLTGRGGWPLNCFALPDGRPVHGGTYFPKAEWMRVLKSLHTFYNEKREEAMQYATDLTNGIKKLDVFPAVEHATLLTTDKIEPIITQWKQNIDTTYGGYNWAPKFPMPNNWEMFLHYALYRNDSDLMDAVMHTLAKMAEGGIYDQVGGGFARYSTDSYWKVPHFEKMLYDNAQLIGLYAHAYQQNGAPLFKQTITQTIDFIERELTAANGLCYSALDADSEGVEGKYYTWTQHELKDLLKDNEQLYSLYYSVDAYGNWEEGTNILYKTRSDKELESITQRPIDEIRKVVMACNNVLLQHREKRIKPGLDDKCITSWNAMMVTAYVDAYFALNDSNYLQKAKHIAGMLRKTMWLDNRLMRIVKNDKVSIHGFAEDYALMCEAHIKLFEATGELHYAQFANELMQSAIAQFYDTDKQLFYFKSNQDVQLVARKVDVNDDVIPGANSTLAKCLYLLGFMFDNTDYHAMVDGMLLRIQHKIEKYPSGFSNWLQLFMWKNEGLRQLIVVGHSARLPQFKSYIPNVLRVLKNTEQTIPLAADKPLTDATSYYLCVDKTCGLPQTDSPL